MIHAFEGKNGTFEATRQSDPGGLPEIGWSHKLADPEDPLWDSTLDLAQADALAVEDLTEAAQGVCLAIGAASLTEGQYAAVIDFAYNEGIGAFAGSTLCKMINAGNLTAAVGEFSKWIYGHVGGKTVILPGLVRRRAAEIAVWNTTS